MEKLQQWQKVKEIVGLVLEKPPAERSSFLDQICGEDCELRAEVESLLSAYPEGDTLFDSPWRHIGSEADAEPKNIGPYRLIRELGVGGMGQVWLAEQIEPVRRQVAVKFIRAGMYDSTTVQRFRAERQSLAIMDHPTIAKVFDAGTTDLGQPYLVMEYVDGLPITEYCDSRKLSIRDRLQLFIRVCEGVHHAHQKAIIHRDLKPSNILVLEVDGKPTPRVIDFGLAKAAAPLLPGETLLTQTGMFLGTPGYTSPEQADPNRHDVDTRTDVYSLGVILYELLSGSLPFDTAQWKRQHRQEIERQLREDNPPRPSTKIKSDWMASTNPAQARSTNPKELTSQLRGDLDWVTMKAIEKDRERRYPTILALASDLQNYMQNRPVAARPASFRYRARKYLQRHAAGVSMASAAIVVLIGFAVMQSIELRRITRERDRADRIAAFMTSMFRVSSPSESRGNTITAREILDKSAREIDANLARDPEVQGQMMEVMGNVYTSLGLYRTGRTLLTHAIETQRKLLGSDNPATLKSMGTLAWNLQRDGHLSEAERLGRETLDFEQRTLGPNNLDTLKTQTDLAWTLSQEGKFQPAEDLFRKALAAQQRTLGPQDRETLLTMAELGWTLSDEARYPEAEKLEADAVAASRHALGELDPITLVCMHNLAGIVMREQRYPEAEKLYRQTIEPSDRVFGPEDPTVLAMKADLGTILVYEGRFAEASPLLSRVYDGQLRSIGPEHPQTLYTMMMLGYTLGALGRFEQGQELLLHTREVERRVFGPDSPRTAITSYNLACLNARRGKQAEALAFLSEALDHGLSPADCLGMESDSDLQSLRGNAAFVELVKKAKQHGLAIQAPQ